MISKDDLRQVILLGSYASQYWFSGSVWQAVTVLNSSAFLAFALRFFGVPPELPMAGQGLISGIQKESLE
jgi:hypothetical protein